MASLATALAIVGVGVALARGERARRSTARGGAKKLNSPAALLIGELSGPGLRRVAIGQLDLAIALLEAYPGDGAQRTVHETRKALKRARAIVRLLRGELGGKRFARENAALRDCARRLAGARDAIVMLEALDGLLKRQPKLTDPRGSDRAGGVRALRAELARAARPGASGSGPGVVRASALDGQAADVAEIERHRALAAELRAIRKRMAEWDLEGHKQTSRALLKGGIKRVYRQGRRRMRRARKRRSDVAAMHAWRKSVKDLRYVAETLDRADAPRPRGKGERRLRAVARRADRLGEMLGEEHDLALLAEVVRRHSKGFNGPRRGHAKLLKAIEKRRRNLHKRALREGEQLYRRKPRRFVRRMGAGL